MPASDRSRAAVARAGAAHDVALAPPRNFHPATSFSARKTATELGREVSACQS